MGYPSRVHPSLIVVTSFYFIFEFKVLVQNYRLYMRYATTYIMGNDQKECAAEKLYCKEQRRQRGVYQQIEYWTEVHLW
jgi:hypothetical protein